MRDTNRAKQAALMAFYTFLLALGAALPMAASYAQPTVSSSRPNLELTVRGYRGLLSTL